MLWTWTQNISRWQYSDLFCPQIQLDYLQAEPPMGTHNKHIPPNIHVSSQLPFLASWSLFMLRLLSTTVCQLLSTTVNQVWSKNLDDQRGALFCFSRWKYFQLSFDNFTYVSMHFYHISSPPLSYLSSPTLKPLSFPTHFLPTFMSLKQKINKQKITTCWVWLGWLPHPWVWVSSLEKHRQLINSYTLKKGNHTPATNNRQ